jgi:polar amino acid transport system substrate-binding protein
MNIISQSCGVLLLGIVTLAGCADRPTGPAPTAELSGAFAIAAASSVVCNVDGATWEGDPDAAVVHDLAPTGPVRVGINYGNPNNATLNPVTGQLSGVAVDLACTLARGTDRPLTVVGYSGVPPMLAGLTSGDVDLAFTLASAGSNVVNVAISHLGVENTYLVPDASPFQSVADVDAPGVLISVAQGNSPDVYLSATLKNATLVRTATVPQALALLARSQVNAFAGSRSAEAMFIASSLPSGRMLPDNFLIANIAAGLPLGHDQGLGYVDEFIDWGKTSGLVQLAIGRSQLIGVSIPPPPPIEQRLAFLQHHIARLVTNGVLNEGQGRALAVKLEGALDKLSVGENEAAMNKVAAFINQVDAFRNAGILSEAQSASLRVIAQDGRGPGDALIGAAHVDR